MLLGPLRATAASIIVSVGRGIKEKDNVSVVEQLAEAPELAAARPICDNGWLPMEPRSATRGRPSRPGAIQHLVGMKGTRTLVAVKGENAPIFEVAPAPVEAIRKAK